MTFSAGSTRCPAGSHLRLSRIRVLLGVDL
jgi:hypothetical protein